MVHFLRHLLLNNEGVSNEEEDVRVGKFLEVRVAEPNRVRAEKLVEELCQKLLANPVIEEYRYELKELAPSPQAGAQ